MEGLLGESVEAFWRRRFGLQSTGPQLVFDLVIGVVGPLACFSMGGRTLFGTAEAAMRAFFYLEVGVLATALALFRITARERRDHCSKLLAVWNSWTAGVLGLGTAFALVATVVLVPILLMFGPSLSFDSSSEDGLVVIPLLTLPACILVFLRATRRALAASKELLQPGGRGVAVLMGPAFAVVLLVTVHLAGRRILEETAREIVADPSGRQHALARLETWSWIVSPAVCEVEFSRDEREAQQEAWDAAHVVLTGMGLDTSSD